MGLADLQIGDRIRLLHVPETDLAARAREEADPEWVPTATVLEHLIATQPVQVIDEIDRYGHPWFSAHFVWGGEPQEHSIALMDEASWEAVV